MTSITTEIQNMTSEELEAVTKASHALAMSLSGPRAVVAKLRWEACGYRLQAKAAAETGLDDSIWYEATQRSLKACSDLQYIHDSNPSL